MIDLLKELILDFQEIDLPTGVPRRFAVSQVQGKATVCMGVRRSGKSTFMFQLMKKLRDSGVPRQNILYLNFFDDRLHRLQYDNFANILIDPFLRTPLSNLMNHAVEDGRREFIEHHTKVGAPISIVRHYIKQQQKPH